MGSAVAISGNTAIVGADSDDDGGTDSGSAYVYRWNGTGWSQLSVNDDCYAGTLDACLTLSSDDDETYAALVTSYAYAYRGIAAYGDRADHDAAGGAAVDVAPGADVVERHGATRSFLEGVCRAQRYAARAAGAMAPSR